MHRLLTPRFSIHDVFMLTAAVAVGSLLASAEYAGINDFLLGALTVFVTVGLGQQIVRSSGDGEANRGSYLRRLGLALILLSMGIAIYRAHVFYVVPTPNLLGDPQETPVGSTIARPLWIFCLLLGAMTAPGMAYRSVAASSSRANRWLRGVLSASVVALFLLFVAYLAHHWGCIPMLVDMAIEGIKFNVRQITKVGDPHHVEWFGRTPSEMRQFVR